MTDVTHSPVVDHGINTLFSTSVNDEDNILAKHLPRISQESDALCAICITIQASLCGRPEAQHLIFKYFDMALSCFRAELGNSVMQLKDGTFAAGLMLSTLGVRHPPLSSSRPLHVAVPSFSFHTRQLR